MKAVGVLKRFCRSHQLLPKSKKEVSRFQSSVILDLCNERKVRLLPGRVKYLPLDLVKTLTKALTNVCAGLQNVKNKNTKTLGVYKKPRGLYKWV